MPLLAILLLAVGTYALRVAGPTFHTRLRISARTQRLLTGAAAVLLLALAATSALTEGQHFAGWARPAGVLVGALLAARKAPFPAIVLGAVVSTALLRLAGVA